jgi:DNA-binding CsgD family transcriptional regulator
VVWTMALLLERERDLDELGRVLDDAGRGRGRVVLVEGDAGIGKTRLLHAASELAATRGFTCLRARASELERDFAHGCVRQWFEPTVVRASDGARQRLFGGAAALSSPLFEPTDTSGISPSADTSFSMLHGLYWLLSNIADDRPVVLAVDDLHWADAESLRFVNYLAPRIDGLAVAVVASVRTRDKGLADLARLANNPSTTVLRPRSLSIDATARLCEERLGSQVIRDFAAACWEATGGNPFFLEVLLREASEEQVSADAAGAARVRRMGPPAVAHAVLLRLSEAPASAGALVRAVAVLGDGASLVEAAILADLAEDEAARAADVLATHQILGPGDALEFAHPIVREAVYADIGARQRAEAHGRAATILAEGGASEERVAAQIVEAEPVGDPGRVELLRRVAADALGRGAPATAVALLRRALAEGIPPGSRVATVLDLSRAELRVAAPEALDRLTTAVGQIQEPGLLTASARLLGNAFTAAGRSDEAVEALASAISVVEPVDPERALFLEADLAAHAQEAGLEARAVAARRLERLAALPGATPGERLVLACLAFERARASESDREAAEHLQRALADGRLLDEQELDVPSTIYILVVGLLATEAVDVTDAVLDRMLVNARAVVSVPAIAFVLAHQGVASMRRGAVARGEADALAALDLLASNGIPLGVELASAVLIEALIERGDLDAAERALAAGGFDRHIPPGMPSNPLLEARAKLRFAQGRAGDALDDLIEFGRRDEAWGGASPMASRWRSRASLVLAALGELDRARRMARDDLERAQRWGAPGSIGVALRARALVEGGAASVERLEEAVAALAASPARLEHARALADLGALLRRDNRRREARGVLDEALLLADRCHASALADRVRTELRAAGGRSSTRSGPGVQELTASERRVAELAADGHSNPEIAQTLFVTRKTVETHLGSVYRKLGITGRGKLARALDDVT